jgi:DHA2 family multidrug resistance protein
MIYGPKRYWLADPAIRYAAIFAAVILFLFLFRQATLKRPLVDLNAFKSGKFIFAILLMLLFWGIKDSINLIYGYSASVLGWSSADIVKSGLFNVAGAITATCIVVKVILVKKKSLPILLLAGFAVMFFYHLWIYMNLTPDLSFGQLCTPIFFHGFACGLLFVPITVFCMAALPPNIAMSGIIICAYARFIATLNSIAGFYSLQLNYNQLYKESFLGKLIPGNDILSQRQELYKTFLASKGYAANEATRISTTLVAKSSAIQSQLLTTRAVFFVATILMAIAFIILVFFAVINKIKAAYNLK